MWIPILTDERLRSIRLRAVVLHTGGSCVLYISFAAHGLFWSCQRCKVPVPVPGNVLVGSLGLCHFPAGHSRVEFALGHCPWAQNPVGTWRFTSAMESWLSPKSVSDHL